jgi:hypothetical protein
MSLFPLIHLLNTSQFFKEGIFGDGMNMQETVMELPMLRKEYINWRITTASADHQIIIGHGGVHHADEDNEDSAYLNAKYLCCYE